MNSATDIDRAMMARALELAAQAGAEGEVPVGAVVYETVSGMVVGEGRNQRECAHDPAGHAEMYAVREAADRIGDWRLTGHSIAVTLEPCPMCAGLLVNARLDRLVYGTADPKAGAVDTLFQLTTDSRLNHRLEVLSGIEAEVCANLLTSFFRQRRKPACDA